ncbi:oligosaccharide flippase family protein [Robertmurraya sp.]|uniref:oligosaccharide flippase family protein n=1 Tax=Robertmurraya sp. TaxID=2837525 RepID=UPI0037041DDB
MGTSQYKIGALLSYMTIFLGNIVGIIYTPIMLRMLGQEEYGLYSLVSSLIATLSLVDLGFGNTTIRYVSKYRALGDHEKQNNLNGLFILINTVILFLTVIIGLILYYFSDNWFSSALSPSEVDKFKIMLIVLTLNLAVSFPFSVFGSIIVAYEKFIFPKVIGIIRTILNPIIVIAVLYQGYDSLGMVIANSLVNILFLWTNVYYCFSKLKIRVSFRKIDNKVFKEISIYSFFIFLGIIVDKIYWSTDQLILGVISGTIAVSVYSIASQLNLYYMQFSTAISGMFLPRITSMVTKDATGKELTDIFIRIGRIQLLILGLIISGLISFGKEFIVIWAGENYIDAYYIALILIIPFTIPLIQNMGLNILQAKNLHKFRSIVLLFLAVVNLLISIPLARMYGGIGCALGTGISMVVGNIIMMNVYYYKKIGLDILLFYRRINYLAFLIVINIVAGFILNSLFPDYKIFTLLIKIVILTVFYFVLMYLLGMNRYEKELIKSIVNPIRKKIIISKEKSSEQY